MRVRFLALEYRPGKAEAFHREYDARAME